MPNFNTITRNLSTDDRWTHRHPWIALMIGIPAMTFSVMIAIMIGVGFAQAVGSDQGPGQITIQKTADQYHDCMTFATADNFAPDVCEPLSTTSQTAILSCAAEVAYGMQQADCPRR